MRAGPTVIIAFVAGLLGGVLGGVLVTRGLPVGAPEDQKPPEAAPTPPPPPARRTLGFLDLDTLPWSVVFLEGEEIGETPIKALKLPPGVHRFRFLPERTGAEVFREVEVRAGETTQVKLVLPSPSLDTPRARPSAPAPPIPPSPPPPPKGP